MDILMAFSAPLKESGSDPTDHIQSDPIARLQDGADATRAVDQWTRNQAADEVRAAGDMAATLDLHEQQQWPDFVRETFGELYGLGTEPAPAPAQGSEWISSVLEQAEQLPEWRELCARSEGDPWRCGLATASVVDALDGTISDAIDKLSPDSDPAADAASAAELEQELDPRMRGRYGDEVEQWPAPSKIDDPQLQRLAQQFAEAQDKADRSAAEAAEAAEAVTGAEVEMRQALRDGIADANQEIDRVEQAMAGLGHGTGSGALTSAKAPTEQVMAALRSNPTLLRIAQIAGRLRISAKKRQALKSTRHGREELYGVEQGGDVERLLPSEQVLLADPDLEVLAYRRILEREALQYQLRGREREERGPVVVLVDNSGSMRGARFEWAMGVALALLEVAAMQNRAFALVHFDDGVRSHVLVEHPRNLTLEAIVKMVTTTFSGGGTDIRAALSWVGQTLLGDAEDAPAVLKGADVVLVSDGVANAFGKQVVGLRDRCQSATYGIAIRAQWKRNDRGPLEDYAEVTDGQIRDGAEQIDGVLSL